jgi:hypothetical protein
MVTGIAHGQVDASSDRAGQVSHEICRDGECVGLGSITACVGNLTN